MGGTRQALEMKQNLPQAAHGTRHSDASRGFEAKKKVKNVAFAVAFVVLYVEHLTLVCN